MGRNSIHELKKQNKKIANKKDKKDNDKRNIKIYVPQCEKRLFSKSRTASSDRHYEGCDPKGRMYRHKVGPERCSCRLAAQKQQETKETYDVLR